MAAECCYGAELYEPAKAQGQAGIANTYLGEGAIGFLGSTTIAYGRGAAAVYDRRLAGRLLRFLKPYRKEVALSVVLLGAISLLEVAGPYLTKVAIDTYVKPASGGGSLASEAGRGLLVLALAYVGVLALAWVVIGY